MRVRGAVGDHVLHLDRRVVHWRGLEDGGSGVEPFDELPVPGIDATGVHGVQTLDDGAALRAALENGDVRRVVVVGGGYIGLEIAEACRIRGLDVCSDSHAERVRRVADNRPHGRGAAVLPAEIWASKMYTKPVTFGWRGR